MSNSILDFLLVLQDMNLFFFTFIPCQDFGKNTNSLIDEFIWSFLMSVPCFKVILLGVEINNPLGVMLPFTSKTKFERHYVVTEF